MIRHDSICTYTDFGCFQDNERFARYVIINSKKNWSESASTEASNSMR